MAPRTARASGELLSQRALNRALLERQLLLRRVKRTAAETIEHLVGMQAQVPSDPYLALWARLDGFQLDELSQMVANREAVRLPLLRTTLHLVTARDCVSLRPVIQPVLDRGLWSGSPFGRNIKGIDVEQLLAAGRALLDERPRSTSALRAALAERWPEYDAVSLAHAVRYLLPVVQVPPRGVWGASAQPTWAAAETFLNAPMGTDAPPDQLVLRYLAAFGPATVADIRTWSWLTGLREVVERLRPQLRTFTDERGRELFDLPDAPRPDPDTPAPVRFLPEYDNIGLSHADRTRVILEDVRFLVFPGRGGMPGSVMVDGYLHATWRIHRDGDSATMTVTLLKPLAKVDRDAVAEEGARLLAFVATDAASRDLRFAVLE